MAEPQKSSVEVPDVSTESAVAPGSTVVPSDHTPEITPAPPLETAKPDPDAGPSAAGAAKPDDKETAPFGEGYLGHKAQGASFPKNLIPSKEFFFFGIESFEPKALQNYLKNAKSSDTAHHNIAWASNTGKGLLFVGDKKNPTGIINLADASEPEIDGPNKFHVTSRGNKHTFKAASTAERDGWVARLKHHITEAKELAPIVTESQTYKQSLASLKPAPIVAKEDKSVDDAPKTEEPAKAEEAPKEGEAAKEEPKEEIQTEEPKRRSASRKRASFFGFGKKEEKKDEHKPDEVAHEAAETPAATENSPAAETAAPATEDEPAEEPSPAERPQEKPTPAKRNSFFGGVFSKKDKKPTEVSKSAEQTAEAPLEREAPVSDATAPVIPPVESTTPLVVDVSNPTTVPVEHVDAAATGEAKKDVKEKRKSSLPFAFGKREKSPVPADGEDKSGKSAFSKLRATIKGKTASKADEKAAEGAAKDEAVAGEASKEAAAAEEAAKDTAPAAEATEATEATEITEAETENNPENVSSSTPAVTAAA